jgi:quercetin dioxygenase-like cupin family protein
VNKSKLTTVLSIAVAALAAAWALQAQQPGFKRTGLQTQDLSVPGRNAVVALAEFNPGVAAGRHTHPGEELGYILEGTIVLEVEGKPPVTLKAGEVFFVPAGVVHDGKNVGAGQAKVLATYIVEKGKPVATPVK